MELPLNILERLKARTSANIVNLEQIQIWFTERGYIDIANALSTTITSNREELAIIETLILTHSNYQNERT